jgi:NAD(P)-dependent dehydrogenase (short-subunit alcohol dehydrogenase family)
MGGTSGIGLATARTLAAENASVVITGRDQARLQAAASTLDRTVQTAVVDATQREALDGFFADLGRFDHLILAVTGRSGAGPFQSLNLGDLRAGLEAKFLAHVAAAQAAVPTLRADGSITFISAASAGMAAPGVAGIGAINAAVEALVRPLAMELAPLRVNAVSPGVIDTPWWDFMPDDQRAATFAQYAQATPVRRIGQAEDVANAILMLVDNTFITGTVLPCDGGLHLGFAGGNTL